VEGHLIERRSRDDAIKVLGCLISSNGYLDLELENRISAAWHAFHSHADSLCFKEVPINRRLQLLKMVVEPALFWCAGTWKLSSDQNKNLRGVQRSMIRKMMGFEKRRAENLDEFFARSEKLISRSLEDNGMWTWDLRARQYYFKWAGTVARMGQNEPERITPKALHFLNISEIKQFAGCHGGAQGHGRRLHVWRWEAEIHGFAHDWEELALMTSEWNGQHLDRFVYNKIVFNNLRTRGVKRQKEHAN
jgi:hypothetical protein